MPNSHRTEALLGGTDEVIVNIPLNEPTRGVAANLAGVKGDRLRQLVGGLGNLHVIKNHRGTFPAQLELHGDEVTPAVGRHQSAHLRAARKAHAIEIRIFRKGRASLFAEPGHDIEHAIRITNLFGQMRHVQGGERCVLRRLDNAGVARRRGRPNTPAA